MSTDLAKISLFAIRNDKLWFLLRDDQAICCINAYQRPVEYVIQNDERLVFKVFRQTET